MDFKLSVQYQLFPKSITSIFQWLHDTISFSDYLVYNSAFYAAFTGRFGQYIGTRDSSPVVGKRFNPKLFYRLWTDRDHEEYLDFTFLGHESNGQSIDSPAEYQAALISAEKPEVVDDQISRGWDYLELFWKKVLKQVKDQRTLSSYVSLKHFLPDGPMQEAEEPTRGKIILRKTAQRVNGIAGMLKFHEQNGCISLRMQSSAAETERAIRSATAPAGSSSERSSCSCP
jgi:hypothetical protein